MTSRVSFHPMSDWLASERVHRITLQPLIGPVADLGSGGRGAGNAHPPWGPIFFNFIQFLEKFGKIACWHPQGVGAPTSGKS